MILSRTLPAQDLEATLAATEAAAQTTEEQREAADARCAALKEAVAALWARVGSRQVTRPALAACCRGAPCSCCARPGIRLISW